MIIIKTKKDNYDDYEEYENKIECFKNDLCNEKEFKNLSQYIIKNCLSEFFDLCCYYSHIVLNSKKKTVTADKIYCLPNNDDIDVASKKTKDFINKYNIQDTNELLDLIHKHHTEAIFPHDKSLISKTFAHQQNELPTVFFFLEYPEETWKSVCEIIIEKMK